MRVLVTTCDKYLHLLEPYTVLFNKYWPNQDVSILGFNDTNIPDLPDNFEYISLGKQSDFGEYWTDPIIPYIDKLEEEYFVVMCADMLVTNYVDNAKINLLEEEIKAGNAAKAVLNTHLSAYTTEYKKDIRKLLPSAPYRTTLHPSIWRKEYFQKYLKPNFTIWDFEIKNMPESKCDGENIILPAYPPKAFRRDPAIMSLLCSPNDVVKVTNVYVKGTPVPHLNSSVPWGSPAGITKEDILFIYKYINPEKILDFDKLLKDGERYK